MPFIEDLTAKQMLMAAGGFGLILSLWLLGVSLMSMRRTAREKAIARRLGEIDGKDHQVRVLRLWIDGHEATTFVPHDSWLRLWWSRFRRFPEDAGWSVPVQSVLMGVGGVVVLLSAVTMAFTQNPLPALGVAVAAVVLFAIYTRYCVARNMENFEQQFSDALQLIARSLRAGHPLMGAFRLTAEEMQAPVSTIFARICQEQSLGVGLEDSLRTAAAESNSPDLKLFTTSVGIQIRSGGNLADMMDRLAEVIRSRIKLSRRIRVVAAQTQFSKRILLALPLLMLLILSIVNPVHVSALFETTMGRQMLLAGGVAMLLGWFTMNRIARLQY